MLIKIKSEPTTMIYPDLGDMQSWVIVGFSDAAVFAMPDKVGSVGGQLLMICNTHTNNTCVLGWRSRQLKRVVHSSLAAEALALLELLGDIQYTRLILKQMYGKRSMGVPAITVTDSKNLFEAVHNLKVVDDRRLVGTIAEIKEGLFGDGLVQELRHLQGEHMLADGLTKRGASSEDFMKILQTGKYTLPGGWKINPKSPELVKTWMDMNNPNITQTS